MDHTTEPQSDLWTSDSEREAARHDSEPPRAASPAAEDAAAADTSPQPAADAAVASEEGTETATRDESGKFVKGKGKPRTDPQARVEAATRKESAAKEEARLAREEARRLAAELEAIRRSQTAQPAKSEPENTFKFPPRAEWMAAHPDKEWDDYDDAKFEAREQWRDQRDQAREAQRADVLRVESHRQRLQAAAAADPSLPAAIDAGLQKIHEGLVRVGLREWPKLLTDAVMESPQSVEIVRRLVMHPDHAIQLAVETASLPASAVGFVRRHLESALTATAGSLPDSASAVRPSAAKAPINRVGGTASIPPAEPDDLEFGPEYIRLENAREKKRREAGRW